MIDRAVVFVSGLCLFKLLLVMVSTRSKSRSLAASRLEPPPALAGRRVKPKVRKLDDKTIPHDPPSTPSTKATTTPVESPIDYEVEKYRKVWELTFEENQIQAGIRAAVSYSNACAGDKRYCDDRLTMEMISYCCRNMDKISGENWEKILDSITSHLNSQLYSMSGMVALANMLRNLYKRDVLNINLLVTMYTANEGEYRSMVLNIGSGIFIPNLINYLVCRAGGIKQCLREIDWIVTEYVMGRLGDFGEILIENLLAP